jgi:chemotaxis protein methyltransferase CheR
MSAQFLDDNAFRAFQEYIGRLTGIHYAEAKRYLLDARVRKRAGEVGCEDAADYLDFLQSDPRGRQEIDELIDQLSIHETSFFRHQKQIEIADDIIAGLIATRRQNGSRSLDIWSAACSSGEEPYTLAMVVGELLAAEPNQWNLTITGTDISARAIARARTARYGKRSVQGVPEPYLSKYFQLEPGGSQEYVLSADIVRMVTFRSLSLLDDFRMESVRNQDLIFCRNVLIYFDTETKKKVLATLWNALRPGGYLMLGPSDSLYGLSDAFQRTPHSVHNLFRRPVEVDEPPPSTPVILPNTAPKVEATAPPTSLSLKEKGLVMRLDRGLNDLQRDFDSALERIIDAVGEIAGIIQDLSSSDAADSQSQMALSRIDRQIARILLFLQVGDRGHQKMEALRGLVQELSDRMMDGTREAPDLQVSTSAFDTRILDEGAEREDESLSQDDIDALFDGNA